MAEELRTLAQMVASQMGDTQSSPEPDPTPAPEPVVPDTSSFAPVVEKQPEPAPTPAPEPTPEPVIDPFVGRLREKGLSIPDEVDPVTAYDTAIDAIFLAQQREAELKKAAEELAAVRAEMERLRQQPAPQAPAPQPAQPTQPETAAQKIERIFRELQPYDPRLDQMVVVNQQTGIASAKPEWGDEGVQAAKAVNEYNRAAQQQAQMLLRNPSLVVKDNKDWLMQELITEARNTIKEELKAYQDQQAKAAEEAQRQAAARAAQEREASWHNSNKQKLWRLNPDGTETINVMDGSWIPTPLGKAFTEELFKLKNRFPGVDELALRDTALEYAEARVPKDKPAPVAPADRRNQFVQQRQAVVPNQGQPSASLEEMASSQPGKQPSFMDFLRRPLEEAGIR